MNDDVWEDLETFVINEAGIFPKKVLYRGISLESDLDITGDDADAFMERFFDYFKVDMGDFDIGRYFLGEGGGLLFLLTNAISKNRKSKFEKFPLTLGMLEKAIVLGKWDTVIVENQNRSNN